MTTPPAYVPAIRHMRTDEERRDPMKSWQRPDDKFFAAGACHVLAFRFIQRNPAAPARIMHIRPTGGPLGSHLYVSWDRWGFDFNGWTPEDLLLSSSTAECRRRWPGWNFELLEVDDDIGNFCARWNHRTPHQFPFDVEARADRYLDRLPTTPPEAQSG